jgi:peptidoglycan/LPS O-acetylase OafA/YrhL
MPALDGLRGAAVAAVLLFHAGHLKGGYLGVDLFFVLSGFLITSLLLAESSATGGIALRAFWARRARRLLPALAGVLGGVALYAWLVAAPTELTRIRGDGLATLFYVANWRAVFAHVDYWQLFASPSPLEHTWSLAIEEQFYLVWPLVIWALLRTHRTHLARRVLLVSGALALASTLAMALVYRPGNPTRVYYGSDTRAASILIGAMLAALVGWRGVATSRRGRRGLEGAGLVGALVLGWAWTRLGGQSDGLYRGGLLLTALGGAAVIAAIAHPSPGPLARVLRFTPLRALGLISYGVYLWHWPVYVFLNDERTHVHGWWLVVLRISVTLVIATVSYRVLEQPIRRGALRVPQLKAWVPAIAVLLLVVLIASTAGANTPSGPTRADPGRIDQALARARTTPSARRVLIVGNSVSFFVGEGFRQLRRDPPLVVLNGGLLACTFPPGITGVRHVDVLHPAIDCTTAWRDEVARFDPDLVVLMISDPGDVAVNYRGRYIQPCTPTYDNLYRRELRKAADMLGAGGARVAIATAAYSYLLQSVRSLDNDDCVNAIYRSVAREGQRRALLDVARFICPTRSTCKKTEHGIVMREDGVHYRGESARWLAGWMMDQLASSS